MEKIIGKVIHGEGKTRKIGYPTANIKLSKKIDPGVYAGKVKYCRKKYLGAVFISKDKEMLFVHMLDFEGDLYGKEIEIEIGKRIRNGRKFVSEDDAKEQIGKDVEAIRKIARNKTI